MELINSISVLTLLGLGQFSLVSCADFATSPPFYAELYTRVASPRSLLLVDSGDILVVSQSRVIALYDTINPDGTTTVTQSLIVNGSRWGQVLNHGLAYSENYLYASEPTAVYRWEYTPGQREEILEEPEIIVFGIPSRGHITRTLIFDNETRFYVTVGSQDDVDPDSSRSKIRRFDLNSLPPGGFNFTSGEVFADGVRNEVGITFDSDGVLWGVENGANNVNRPDLGENIRNGNPGEEVHRFDNEGDFYGYPYCFSSHRLSGYPSGTQFAWQTFLDDGIHSDEWCQNTTNNIPPVLTLPDHSAPLGITFYEGTNCDNSSVGAFPCSMREDAIVTMHGANPTYNDPPSGYRVAWLPFYGSNSPSGEVVDIIYDPDTRACHSRPGGCFRPVNAIFNNNGHLIVSADSSGEIFKVYYNSSY